MSSTRKYSHNEDWDSFEDLERSLDKALKQAPSSLFGYNSRGSEQVSRQASQGSITGIPMTNLKRNSSQREVFRDDELDDDSPLIDSRFGQNGRAFMANRNRGGWRQNLGGYVRGVWKNLVELLKLAKHELNQERKKQSMEEGTGEAPERFVTPQVKGTKRSQFPTNGISNAKYNPITFIPIILFEQFKFFFNLYFLLVALSQIVPQLRIGYLSSYIVPLVFVLTVTMLKEMGDDIARRRRDRDQNNELFEVLNRSSSLSHEMALVASQELKVGDVVRLHKGKRIPADMILLQTSDKEGSGEAFIKTDQLDGETDWKLRVALNVTQKMSSIEQLCDHTSFIVESPSKSIHHFNGKLVYNATSYPETASTNEVYPLTIDQTLWANTVLALGTAIGIVIYTGVETRQQLNSSKTGVKTGLLELEINKLSKILCFTVFLLSVFLVMAGGWPLSPDWYLNIMRFLILFSTIIPVSLRVNLDLAKYVYASQIEKDTEIPNTIVRTSTIPEDLGRIEYLLSDKTGTLTQNDMELKKIHLGSVSYAADSLDLVYDYVANLPSVMDAGALKTSSTTILKKRDMTSRVCELILTLALCHNVTPTYDEDSPSGEVSYQAASPDEIAIVKFTERVGLKLSKRDRHSISLFHIATNQEMKFQVLYNFPFSSDTKRMGLIVKDLLRDDIYFMQKGADSVMSTIVSTNDWLNEETGNMAREGLRTLVVGRKKLTPNLFKEFTEQYEKSALAMTNREVSKQRVIGYYLEKDLELLGLTGVEDKLQKDVKASIELLRNAGIKIWMLTGDKVETAKCVSINAKIISRGQYVHQITNLLHSESAMGHLEILKSNMNSCLLIDGESLAMYIKFHKMEFFETVIHLPAVIACRCTPQQKADIAIIIKEITGKRVCCIGDGGNDVSMIQSADVGVGIVGKEGKQASLAADFSIDQFCYLLKLLLWHGRNSYKRSAKLGQFVIYRGLLISVAQAVYSISSSFEPLTLYQGWLMVGYSTLYTMAPVFSLVLDYDIDEKLTRLYPELYKELTLGRSLSYRTFFMWVLISLYQGCVIQLFSQAFQTLSQENFLKMVSLSFSCLVFNELIMVALLINRWNKIMFSTIVITFLIYIGSILFLKEYFDLKYMASLLFTWQSVLILVVSLFPVWASIYINRRLRPPTYAKVQQD